MKIRLPKNSSWFGRLPFDFRASCFAQNVQYPQWMFRQVAQKAAIAWANRNFCPECGWARHIHHAPGCSFPARMADPAAAVDIISGF